MNLRLMLKKLEVPQEGDVLPDRWINNDIKPLEEARRTWGFWSFHNLWVITNINITTYMLGSSMIAIGLTRWQSIMCIVLGSLLGTVFIVLNSMAGAYYHIGFPVANRYTWGMYGSQFVVLNRVLLSVVWYAIQAWIGGQCTYVCLRAIWQDIESRIPNHMPAGTGMTAAEFTAYVLFSVMSIPLIMIRPHKLQPFFWVTFAIDLITWVTLLTWALATMGPEGFGSTITQDRTAILDTTGWTMIFGIVSTIGGISSGILNQNDYSRFARDPRVVVHGQLAASSLYYIFSAVIGILVTAATQNRYGEAFWSLPNLLSRIIETGGTRSRIAAFVAAGCLIISQFGVNVPGNALSGGCDLAATFPRFINIRRGAYITVFLSMVVNPWNLLSTASIFLSVMSAYGVFLGPMVALMVTSFFVIYRQKINVDDLYIGNRSSVYWCAYGVDWRACVAWICGVAPHMPGFIASLNSAIKVPIGFSRIYYVNFLTGFSITSAVFIVLHTIWPNVMAKAFVEGPMSRTATIEYYKTKWDAFDGSGVAFPNVLGKVLGEDDQVTMLGIPQSI